MRTIILAAWLAAATCAAAATHEVRDPAGLKRALASLTHGDSLVIHPGTYPGGNSLRGLERLTIEAADPANPPEFRGGTEAWHFTRCPNLTLRNLRVTGQSGNGINLDDGAPELGPVAGTTIENLEISDIGPDGNFDALKCSGLTDLLIRNCRISGWGGQAIDLVGCQRVQITGCTITGKPGFSQHTGPQFKGGCEDITIENCQLINAGQRPVQAGGSTGMAFFRPPGAKFEARRITIRNNRIEGGECATAFTGVDGAEFSGNTIVRPTKWIFRILTETTANGFPRTRNVRITNNSITFRRAAVTIEINIGPNTSPETFTFAANHWLAEDQPVASKPTLPTPETDATYGKP